MSNQSVIFGKIVALAAASAVVSRFVRHAVVMKRADREAANSLENQQIRRVMDDSVLYVDDMFPGFKLSR